MTVLQLFLTYSSNMNLLFGTTPIGPAEWASVLGGGLAIYIVVGAEKRLRLRAGIKVSE